MHTPPDDPSDEFRRLSVSGERQQLRERTTTKQNESEGNTSRSTFLPNGPRNALEGLDEVLDSLRELIAWPIRYRDQGASLGVRWPKGVLVHGPSGVGKTAAVRTVCDESGADIHLVTPASVIGQYMGESEKRLREVFERAEARSRETGTPSVVLIEEADSLFPQRRGGSQQDARLVAQLLTLMDGAAAKASDDMRSSAQGETDPGSHHAQNNQPHHVAVVAITTHPNAIDPALRRPGRLDREIAISVPGADARLRILERLAGRMNLAEDVDLRAIAARCHGYTGADLQSLCSGALVASLTSCASSVKNTHDHDNNGDGDDDGDGKSQRSRISQSHFEQALPTVGASVARSVVAKFPPASWDDVGGLEDVKQLLIQYCVWPITRSDDFKRLGIDFPKGVLLHGPPGCAKTTLARAAVTASGATFIPLLGTSLYSMYVGEGEAELRRAFQRARLSSPSVLFVDELDSLVGNRDGEQTDTSSDVSSRLLTTFLTELDGIDSSSGVLILGTTNRPCAIDAALLRPGRFDRRIYVPPPDRHGRIKALQVHTKRVPLDPDVDLERLAAMTERYTGAELQAICREATISALRGDGGSSENTNHVLNISIPPTARTSVTMQDFIRALDAIPPAHSAQELDHYERQYT